jgi:hypothetical protein
VNGWWLRAAALEDSVRPRRLVRASGRPLNFTARRHPTHSANLEDIVKCDALALRGSVGC